MTDIHDPVEPVVTTIRPDMSNAESVDETPSRFATWMKAGFIILFVGAIVIVGAATAMKQIFPEWAKRNQKELDGIRMVTSAEIVTKAAKVNWLSAFKKKNVESLKYVGTGRHPEMKASPALKQRYFFTGQVFMMKDYVKDFDMLSADERARLNKHGGLKFPAIGVSHDEATEYCQSLGTAYRLPTYDELIAADNLMQDKEKKKIRGRLKPNLKFTVYDSKDQWTSTGQPSAGFFSSFRTDDNYRIFSAKSDGVRYEDDDYDDENLSFRCVKEPEAKL